MSRLHSHQIRLHNCLQYALLGFLKSPFWGEDTRHQGAPRADSGTVQVESLRGSSRLQWDCRLWILTLFRCFSLPFVNPAFTGPVILGKPSQWLNPNAFLASP